MEDGPFIGDIVGLDGEADLGAVVGHEADEEGLGVFVPFEDASGNHGVLENPFEGFFHNLARMAAVQRHPKLSPENSPTVHAGFGR